jgi:hypothetical protein
MKHAFALVFIGLLVPSFAAARKSAWQTGSIVSMNSVPCGSQGKGHRSIQLLCHEYLLRTTSLDYRFRQQDPKHGNLLPVGAQAQFRLVKDVMHLRVFQPDGKASKEYDYLVISVVQRYGPASNPSPQ